MPTKLSPTDYYVEAQHAINQAILARERHDLLDEHDWLDHIIDRTLAFIETLKPRA